MKLWAIIWNDLKLAARDRMFFFWLLVFPLLFIFIFGLAFPESSAQEQKVALNILDQDQNFLSRALIKELQSEKYAIKLLPEKQEIKTRLLIIPENFTQNIVAGQKVELVLEKKADSNLKASQAAYSHILKGVIKLLAKVVALSSEESNQLEQKFNQYQLKQLIQLRSSLGGKLKRIPAGFNHTIPAVVVMFILFTVLMYGGMNLLEERRHGQLERIYLNPISMPALITSKWLSRLLLGLLQVVILFLVGKILFHIYLGQSLMGVFLISFFFCGTIAGLSLLLGSIFRKEELLLIINILLANLMASLGGCWWPLELVPKHLQMVA
ncbi:MAG: ABC transporter permease, partial [Candidatus Aminicenantales bacterium]